LNELFNRKIRGYDDDNNDGGKQWNLSDIIEIIKTKSASSRPDEYTLLTKTGMYFINIKKLTQPGNANKPA
jgi:hypothetical protein